MSPEITRLQSLVRARILIVEDELIVAKDLQDGLTAVGYTICGTASTGAVAVRRAQELQPDLILMDIRLRGGMDGIEVARQVRESADVPIVFLTAYADHETLERAASIGPYAYLLKPFDDRELQITITMALCKHRAFAEKYGRLESVAQLSLFALESGDPKAVAARAMEVVTEALGVELAGVLEEQPDGTLALRPELARHFSATDLYFLGTITSLVATTKKRATAEAEARTAYQTAQLAADAVRARDEFLSIASHELRTPVAALKLQIETLRELLAPHAAVVDDRIAQRVERATMSVARLARLVENVLDISRIKLGVLALASDEIDLADVVREVTSRHEDLAKSAGCDLRIATEPVRGTWDRVRIEQVVTNLLANALNFAAGNPIDITVEPVGDDAARLTVRDHGDGIEAHDTARILGRYERASSARSFGGLGLGLYIVGQIVEAHGGSLEVEGGRGVGATFTVTIPRNGRRSA